MSADALAQQIKDHLDKGEWSEASRLLLDEWNAASDFGMYHFDLPGYPPAWVKFKLTGYPFKLRRQWAELLAASDFEGLARLIVPHVAEWNLQRADGQAMPAPAECAAQPETLSELEDAVLFWLERVFFQFWQIDLMYPRKN